MRTIKDDKSETVCYSVSYTHYYEDGKIEQGLYGSYDSYENAKIKASKFKKNLEDFHSTNGDTYCVKTKINISKHTITIEQVDPIVIEYN